MALSFDHVLIAVNDLSLAASDFRDRYGLESSEGGRHTGFGTANRVIPLGDSYIELIAVADEEEAAGSPLGRWVREMCSAGDRPAAVCLRTDDIEATAASIGSPALAMQRVRPDGAVLSWRLCGLESTLQDPALPFFIQWHIEPKDFPGSLPETHPNAGIDLAWVELGISEERLRERVGAQGPDLRPVQGTGVVSVRLSTPHGPTVIK